MAMAAIIKQAVSKERLVRLHNTWESIVAIDACNTIAAVQWKEFFSEGLLFSSQKLHLSSSSSNIPHTLASPVLVSPDGRLVFSGNNTAGSIKVLNAETGELVHTIVGHHGCVLCLSLEKDGMGLVSGHSPITFIIPINILNNMVIR